MIIELKSRHQTGKTIFRELENCFLQASSPFLRMFSFLSGIYFPIYTYFQMSSVNCFSLDRSVFWFSGNGLDGCELKTRYQTGKKIFREMEKLLVTSKFSFLRMFSLLSGIYFPIYTYFQTFASCSIWTDLIFGCLVTG